MADVDLTPVEMDGGDQSVFVSANVEHDKVSDFVRCGEGRPQGFKARKVVLLHDFEPSDKGVVLSGCCAQNWRNVLREMTYMQ